MAIKKAETRSFFGIDFRRLDLSSWILLVILLSLRLRPISLSAAGLISVQIRFRSGRFLAMAIAMAPEPVPISSRVESSGIFSIVKLTILSVSGLGVRTLELSLSSMLKKLQCFRAWFWGRPFRTLPSRLFIWRSFLGLIRISSDLEIIAAGLILRTLPAISFGN